MNRTHTGLVAGTIWLVFSSGCLGPLDTLGNETVVTEQTEYQTENPIEDDRIQDKNPSYDPEFNQLEQFGECQITLNKSGSVTKLDIAPFLGAHKDLQTKLFSGREAAAKAVLDQDVGADLIPSMEVVNGKLKPFNDGLYASIEMNLQEGKKDLLQSKRKFLHDLLSAIQALLTQATPSQARALDDALVFVAAALLVGGHEVDLPAESKSKAQAMAEEFLANGQQAKPVGFYAWSGLLEEVFRQDRFLQNLDTELLYGKRFGLFAAVAVVLQEHPELLERYQQILALYAGLTNPFASYSPIDLLSYVDGLASLDNLASIQASFDADHPDLMTCTRARFALLPSSRSKDSEFYNTHWCLNGLPPEINFIDRFILAIRTGEVDLTPDPDSGWYDYQLWALETLLLPERGLESQHLLLTAAYKKKLMDTFKSIITQHRETHVKQLQGAATVSAPQVEVEIYPLFKTEPFPTYYLRTARGYRFLSLYLEGVLGAEFMSSANRVREDGQVSTESLAEELSGISELLYGLFMLSSNSVGLKPTAYLLEDELGEVDLEACQQRAEAWLEGWLLDEDILRDPRVIVPVSINDGEDRAVYWAILGVKAIKISAEFVEGYQPEVVDSDFCKVTGFVSHNYVLLVEHMEEVRLFGSPPSREEFRAICDQHDTVEGILAALEAWK